MRVASESRDSLSTSNSIVKLAVAAFIVSSLSISGGSSAIIAPVLTQGQQAAAQIPLVAPSNETLTFKPKCDPTLWNHVYHPSRLQVVAPCKFAAGIVTEVKSERDGDYHILLKPDARYLSLVNAANRNGTLVLEPICMHTVTQISAKEACANFQQNLTIPFVGQHIRVAGSYVLDHDHGNWAEIHPITSLTVLRP